MSLPAEQTRHLRWAGGLMLGAGLVMTRLPSGLGLPCPLRTLTGVPCPFCGLQTSVEATLSGHLGQAVTANPVGVAAVLVAVVLLVARPERVPVPALPVAVAGISAMWIFELARFGLLPGFG